MGTPSYMAPEQAAGQTKQLTTAADVYSLGAVLYELLTGRAPFGGATLAETMRQVMEVEPGRPRLLNPALDKDLETICLKCLEKDPLRRYGSAAALADDLERWLAHEPIVARPIGGVERTIKWAGRRPAAAALAVTSGVMLAALVGLVIFRSNYKREQKQHLLVQSALKAERQAKEAGQTARDNEAKQRQIAEDALAQAGRANYFRNITWAQRDWESNNVSRADQLLDECPAVLRGWEWRYLKRLCHSDLLTLRHSHPLNCVAFNRDGQYLAAGGADGTIIVWSPMTGEELFKVPKPVLPEANPAEAEVADPSLPEANVTESKFANQVTSIAFNPASGQLVTARGNSLQVWAFPTGEALPVLNGHSDVVKTVAFSADGQWLASGSRDKTIKIWNAVTGELLRTLTGHTEAVSSVAFSPDGKRLLTGSGEIRAANMGRVVVPGEVKLWEVSSSQLISSMSGRGRAIGCVAISPEGQYLVAGDSDGFLHVWESATLKALPSLKGHDGGVLSLSFSRDSRRLISGGADQTVKVWDMASRTGLFTCRGHDKQVNAATVSPDGKFIASVSEDNTLKLWDASTAPESKVFESKGVCGLAFSPDGTHFAATGLDSLEVWHVVSGERVLREGGGSGVAVRSRGVAFSLDGAHFASSLKGMGVKIWNTATWKAVHTFPKSTTIYGLAFSPDGAHLATGGGELGSGQVRIWEVGSGKEIKNLEGLKNPAYNVIFSPDGGRLAVATGNFGTSMGMRPNGKVDPGQVVIFGVNTGAVVSRLYGHKRCIWDVAYSPDGKILASTEGYYQASTDPADVILWDVATGDELRTLSNQETCIFSISFSPDGKRLATTAGRLSEEKPLPIYLWDVATGREILNLNGHTGTIYDVTFSADGSRMASASKDGTVRVWDAEEVTPENQTARRAAVVGPEAMERARRNNR